MSMPSFTSGQIDCHELVELITEYLENALPRKQRRRFARHLAGCENCTEYLDQMRRTIASTGQLRPDDLTSEMLGELTSVFRRWQSEAD
jgi:anti-sigma factor RsiW